MCFYPGEGLCYGDVAGIRAGSGKTRTNRPSKHTTNFLFISIILNYSNQQIDYNGYITKNALSQQMSVRWEPLISESTKEPKISVIGSTS